MAMLHVQQPWKGNWWETPLTAKNHLCLLDLQGLRNPAVPVGLPLGLISKVVMIQHSTWSLLHAEKGISPVALRKWQDVGRERERARNEWEKWPLPACVNKHTAHIISQLSLTVWLKVEPCKKWTFKE
jgi:hypothetical protein